MQINIPADLTDRLQKVAKKHGDTPTEFAQRAISDAVTAAENNVAAPEKRGFAMYTGADVSGDLADTSDTDESTAEAETQE